MDLGMSPWRQDFAAGKVAAFIKDIKATVVSDPSEDSKTWSKKAALRSNVTPLTV